MDFHHDNALQMNLCLKALELENLLCHKDALQLKPALEVKAPLEEKVAQTQEKKEIHFENYQYKVYQNSNYNARATGTPSKPKPGPRRDPSFSNAINVPYPEQTELISLRSLITLNNQTRMTHSAYTKVIKKLSSVNFYLKEMANQRERLVSTIQRTNGQKKETFAFTKIGKAEEFVHECCRNEVEEDLQQIILKATEAIQGSTMETNLYRGMIVLVRNNCDSFDAYSSMTSRVMLKEFEDCIDDVMTILNDFIGCYKTLARFEEYPKHSELLVAVESLIICIRCCASYTWAMESRYGIVASRNEKSRISNTLIRTPETRDINIGSI